MIKALEGSRAKYIGTSQVRKEESLDVSFELKTYKRMIRLIGMENNNNYCVDTPQAHTLVTRKLLFHARALRSPI